MQDVHLRGIPDYGNVSTILHYFGCANVSVAPMRAHGSWVTDSEVQRVVVDKYIWNVGRLFFLKRRKLIINTSLWPRLSHKASSKENKTNKQTLFNEGDLWPSDSRSNWNLEMLVFWGEGKTGEPGEKPLGARTRTNNKLNPHLTPSPGIEPRPHWWEACVGGKCSTTAPSLQQKKF